MSFLLLYLVVYLTSIILNAESFSGPRLYGGLYNLSIWLVGGVAFMIGASSDWRAWDTRLPRISLSIYTALAVISLLALSLWYAFGVHQFQVATPFSTALRSLANSAHLMNSSSVGIVEEDWRFGQIAPRTRALGPYPTATAATFLILFPYFWSFVPRSRIGRALKWIVFAGAAAAFFLAFSRTAMLALAVSSLVWAISRKRNRIVFALPIILISVFALLPAYDYLFSLFNEVREGSSNHRLALYQYQLSAVIDRSPLLGFGIKERVELFNVPIGSHSTYFGAIYKTGLIGGFLVAAFQMSILGGWFFALLRARTREHVLFLSKIGFSIVAITIWMTGEDIDAPQFVSFMYFLIAGLVFAPVARRAGQSSRTEHLAAAAFQR